MIPPRKCNIFVSDLHPETTSSDVMKYLKAEYNGDFKIYYIRTQINLGLMLPCF